MPVDSVLFSSGEVDWCEFDFDTGVIIHNWGRSTSTLDTVEDLNKLGVVVSFYDVMDAFNKLTEVKVYGGIEV